MKRMDAETALTTLRTMITSKLDVKITEINQEKDDGIILDTIPAAAVVDTINDVTIGNFNQFLYYQLVETDPESITVSTILTLRYVFAIYSALSANYNGTNGGWLIPAYRYQRALYEIILENADDVDSRLGDLTLALIPPTVGHDLEDNPIYSVGGILVECKIII